MFPGVFGFGVSCGLDFCGFGCCVAGFAACGLGFWRDCVAVWGGFAIWVWVLGFLWVNSLHCLCTGFPVGAWFGFLLSFDLGVCGFWA